MARRVEEKDSLFICICLHRDAADLVVQGNGKFEELMVCSHEIAASTAQLVAASKVGFFTEKFSARGCN